MKKASVRKREVRLGDVILGMKDGGTPPRSNPANFGGDIAWCVVKDIAPEIRVTKEALTESGLQNSSARIWPIDSVIISLGATIGKVGLAKIPLATKQGLSGIVVDSSVIAAKYLYYTLLDKREFILSLASGTTIKEVRPPKLQSELTFLLPPLTEQKRIIAKLDKQLASIERMRQAVALQSEAVSVLSQAYLHKSLLPVKKQRVRRNLARSSVEGYL